MIHSAVRSTGVVFQSTRSCPGKSKCSAKAGRMTDNDPFGGEVLGIRLGAAKTKRADASAGANSGKQAPFIPVSRALTFPPNHEVCSEAFAKASRKGESSGIHDRQPQISPLWLDRPETGFRTDGRRDHPEKANQGGFHARPRIPGRGQGFDLLPESY